MRSVLVVVVGAMCLVFAFAKPAAALPPGSYLSSCRNIQQSGTIVNAQCTNAAGKYISTSINMRQCPGGPVGNNNGTLFCEAGGSGWKVPAGSWQTTCRNGRMVGSVFHAECTNWAGQIYRLSSLNIANCPSRLVGNNNGILFCEGGGGGPVGNLPGGSWRSSCRDGRMVGYQVYASCTDDRSNYRSTEYNMHNCPGWALGNRNGILFCEAGNNLVGRLPGGSWQNSCRGASMAGRIFSAQCTQDNGNYRSSSIDMRSCPSRLVGNRNGQLFCEGPGNWGMRRLDRAQQTLAAARKI
jgi:hypothetical protein